MTTAQRSSLALRHALAASALLLAAAASGCGSTAPSGARDDLEQDEDHANDDDEAEHDPSEHDSGAKRDAGGRGDASTRDAGRDAGAASDDDGGESAEPDAGATERDAGEARDGGSKPTQPSSGGFPKVDEPVNVARTGPFKVGKYTEGLANRAYASSVMYYPTDGTPPYPAVAFSPGFTATKESYERFLGPLLASHGIALLLTTPTTTGDFPQQRAEDLSAALEQIKKENEREGSPLKGKIATDRLCVTGHSMGGGGTLWAANALGSQIKCAVPLQPWQPGQSFNKIAAATLFIAAQNDTIAGVASNAATHYRSIPASVPKYYAEFAGASHFLTTNTGGNDGQARYMIAFYKAYLENDERYLALLQAPKESYLSKYEHTP